MSTAVTNLGRVEFALVLQLGELIGFTFPTALRNHMRIVFEEMSSWTPLTMYLRDENNILDQMCIKQICPYFYYDDF